MIDSVHPARIQANFQAFRWMAALVAGISALFMTAVASAAPSPFGVGLPEAASSTTGWGGWLLAESGRFYQGLSSVLRTWKESGSAIWTLIGLSLAYGIFHAAGPGHGKAVISGYLFASGDTLRWGVALAFASAMVQALSAILLVGALKALVGATAATMDHVTLILERVSYATIAAVGAWLVWRKTRNLWTLAANRFGMMAARRHDASCNHGPPALPINARARRRAILGTVLSVGIRPCSGAIFVLVFAMSQGLFLAGVVSTFAMALGTAATVAAIACLAVGAKSLAVRLAAPGSRWGSILLGGAELLAALLVLAIGVIFLIGATRLPS